MMRRFAGTTAALLVLWSMGGLIQGTAAAETTDLTLVRSAIALGPAADGSPVEVKTFYKDEKIRFYTKLSFDSTRGSAGPHRLVYKWYTGDVVSHTFGGEKRFDVSPTEWWAYLSVSQMGPGAHRAELYLDDRLFASGEFSIKAGARPFEPEEDTEVKDAVFALLVAGDTQQFDQLAARYRTSQERTTSGTWKLSLLYNAVDPNSFAPKDPRWQALRDMSDAWLARQPDSATAVALNARILYVHAWAWRAERALHAMPAEDRAQYEQLIERARSVLDQHAAVALQDPEWDTLRISIANQQGADSDEILAMADRALQRWPYFYAIHNAAVNALLPRSGGSRQAIQKYTELALERSPAEGTQAYARIYYYIARTATHQAFDELNRTGEKYQRFHESITQILRSYPSPFNQDIARNFAGLAGDVVAYREYGRSATDAMIPVAWWDTSQRRDCSTDGASRTTTQGTIRRDGSSAAISASSVAWARSSGIRYAGRSWPCSCS